MSSLGDFLCFAAILSNQFRCGLQSPETSFWLPET